MRRALPVLFPVLASCVGGGRPEAATGPATSRPGHAVFNGTAMGTHLGIEVYGPDQETCDRAVRAARDEIDRLDRMLTDWQPESPLMDINHAAGVRPVKPPPELFFLIRKSLQLSELTGGAFDITFAGAGRLWRWRDPDPAIPDEAAVRAALENVGWKKVVLDEAAQTVFLPGPDMRIGLDAIAPGYAGDLAMEKIKSFGIQDAMVDMSGDLVFIGLKEGKPWRVGIRHPRKPGENLAVLPIAHGGAVSTSGDYERFFVKDGRRYNHIIDPRTGYPADQVQSATVLAPVLAYADALATGVFVLGPERGMALIEKLEGVEGIIVDAKGEVHVSKGLER